ncbi:hypothetical protein EUTSA_v10009307mg [Eutrema salsugineum]|uniref:Uncharacterized protein n=2 Tax=Eutrema salsugineum TaxID=72664 RepID=V4L4E8_EUTSA|nr:hypothetical protein EUTSA_v10009307mg [Eutrema salsugineum]
MVDGEGSFKRPGAVPFNWEIRPGVPKTRNTQPDDPTLLQPPKKLPPLRLKQLPPSNQPSPSSPSSSIIYDSKTRPASPFAPPSSLFKLKPHPDSDHHSLRPPTPYWRFSSPRAGLDSGDSLRRWRFLKSLVGLKKSKKKTGEESTSSDSDIFYESETTFSPSEGSSRGSVSTRRGSPKSSLSSRRGSPLKRHQSDLSSYDKKTILMMARDRLA